MSAAAAEAVSVAELVAAVRRQQTPRTVATPRSPHARRGVNVVGAHPGAGATVVALALADALEEVERAAILLDLAEEPDAFAATECEIDAGTGAWRAGRRGRTRVLRRRASAGTPSDIPEAPDLIVDGRGVSTDMTVLVCRATVPSIRRAEAALASDGVLAVVGVSRWPKVVAASLGPRLGRATDDGRVVFLPFDRSLALNGVDAEPLPRNVRASGQRLIRLLWPDAVEPAASGDKKRRSR